VLKEFVMRMAAKIIVMRINNARRGAPHRDGSLSLYANSSDRRQSEKPVRQIACPPAGVWIARMTEAVTPNRR